MQGPTQVGRENAANADATAPLTRSTTGPGPRAAPAPGVRLGRFTLLERLGEGGMGVVYSAYDERLDRRVAIKFLSPRAQASPDATLRTLREGQAMARLSHPNVVAVYDIGTTDEGVVFLSMEYVPGETLRAWLERSPPSEQLIDVLIQAGRGLEAAHRAGLVHRDFKPANVLVDSDGRARVTDFGIARVGDMSAPDGDRECDAPAPLEVRVTQSGSTPGTPAYMAPEQLAGARVDAHADQFAFCVTVCEALTGTRPHVGEAGVRVPPLPADSKVPARVHAALVRGLSAEPGERYADMAALLAELERRPPTRRRARIITIATLAIAIGGGASGVYLTRTGGSAPVDRCRATGDRIDDIWGPAAKQRVGDGIRATEAAYAADAWTYAETALDDYAVAWTAAHDDTCEAFHNGRQSTDMFDRRMACLEGRLAALDTWAELYSSAPDAALVERTAESVASLPDIAACNDSDGLATSVAPPADPEARARIAELGADLERAEQLIGAGRPDQARELVDGVLAAREAGEFAPLRGRGLLAASRLHADNLDRAEEILGQAAAAAAAGRDDRLSAEIWQDMLFHVGVKRGRSTDLPLLRVAAEQALIRTGDPPDLRRDYHLRLGAALVENGRRDEGIRSVERAYELTLEHDPPGSLARVPVLNAMCIVRRLQGRTDEAIEIGERAIEILEATVGPLHPKVAGTLNNLGVVETSRGEYEAARKRHLRQLEILEVAVGPEHPAMAEGWNNLASAVWELGDKDEAEDYLRRALALLEHAHGRMHPRIAAVLSGLADAAQRRGRCSDAVAYTKRAIEILTAAHGSDHGGLPDLRKRLGDCLANARQ